MRTDRDDLTAQKEGVATAREDLADALAVLQVEARKAEKAARSRTGRPDVDRVTAAHLDVDRAREALDIATYDLQTAAGHDG
ncbi:hypothetical protein ACFCZ3_20265 [Cellulosimicrobium cellulans]|uniref:hypothetical protein n=1 Tax=Cellulosimicrobium cellulans TaxID=1710 RepID=UPI0035E1AF3E